MLLNHAQIASAAAAVFAPFAPYLVEGGKKFAGKAGEAAWMKAQELWGKIRTHFGDDPKINGAALVVSADPHDESSQALLAKALAARLQEQPDLVQEFVNLLGGQDSVQRVLADHGSLVEDVTQEMTGAGTQIIEAGQESDIRRVRQIKH